MTDDFPTRRAEMEARLTEPCGLVTQADLDLRACLDAYDRMRERAAEAERKVKAGLDEIERISQAVYIHQHQGGLLDVLPRIRRALTEESHGSS